MLRQIKGKLSIYPGNCSRSIVRKPGSYESIQNSVEFTRFSHRLPKLFTPYARLQGHLEERRYGPLICGCGMTLINFPFDGGGRVN
jgi:hypothetical protein